MDFYNDLILDAMDINDLNNGENVRRRKMYKRRIDPFELSDEDFKGKYRFTKGYVRAIVDIVRDDLQKDSRGGSISCNLQVLTALRTWARNEVQDDAGDLHGLSQQCTSSICRRVGIALARRSGEFIKMPSTMEEQEAVIAKFRQICGFRNVIGAIDCTHIKIKKVPGEVSQYYINRKGYSSLNVQVICEASLRILDIVASWRGSTHDSRIFRESFIKQRFDSGEFRGRLLGDSGYACTPYLFTPILNPSNGKEENYNRAQIHTRNVVERCFGLWKQRFRCLLHGFSNSLQNTKTYIVALAVLHNIAIDMKGEYDEECPVLPPEAELELVDNLPQNEYPAQQGKAARAAFINTYF